MAAEKFQQKIEDILSCADVAINGSRPWDMKIYNDRLYPRVLAEGSLGLGDSYVENWWECERLDEFFRRVLGARLDTKIKCWKNMTCFLKARATNRQRLSRSFQVGEQHYDIGNDLYQNMLDRRMAYSCGYWPNAKNLDEAQEAKLDLCCKKLRLEPNMKVLDIGCGWGSFAKFAAEKYDVKVTGITVSKEQKNFCIKSCKGLPVDVRLQDYREINEKFDRIISIGMFEHVGYKNYRTYMEVVRRCLKQNGLFLLHTMGNNKTVYHCDPWFDKYIFPNGMIPSIAQIEESIRDLFVMEDWQNLGADYDKTLMAWYENFEKNWGNISENPKYDNRFRRMWRYYLLSLAGSFRVRQIQVWQIIFSPNGLIGGYNYTR